MIADDTRDARRVTTDDARDERNVTISADGGARAGDGDGVETRSGETVECVANS